LNTIQRKNWSWIRGEFVYMWCGLAGWKQFSTLPKEIFKNLKYFLIETSLKHMYFKG